MNVKAKPPERDVIETIRNRYQGLGKTYKRVADFILNNLELATFVSLGEISKQIGVSDVTVIRFAREMGYRGYQELREGLVDHIKKILYPVQKLALSVGQKKTPVLEAVKQTDIEFINGTIGNLNRDWFEKMIGLIISAERVFCLGWGLSAFLAEFLCFQLRRLSFSACAITRDRRPMLEQILFLRKGDLLIAFDLLVYSMEVLEAIEYLYHHHRGVKILTITNDSSANIVQYADLSFFCETLGLKKSTLISLVAPMCLINCIVEEVIVRSPARARKAIREFQGVVLSNERYYSQFEFNRLK